MRNDGVEVGQRPPRPVKVIRHGWALAFKDFAATKLAFAPRGGATLASFLPDGAPELAVLGAVPPQLPAPAATSAAAPRGPW